MALYTLIAAYGLVKPLDSFNKSGTLSSIPIAEKPEERGRSTATYYSVRHAHWATLSSEGFVFNPHFAVSHLSPVSIVTGYEELERVRRILLGNRELFLCQTRSPI